MVDERAPALARRLTAHARVLRRGRIFARLREGWAYDEIAAHERLTAERVRQIVRKALEKRIIDEEAEHAKLQLARLQPAMRLAGEAIADGDVTAIAPLMKVLDRLDRYQRAAKAVQVYDDEARKKLMDKINRVVANLGVDEPAASGGEAAALADARAAEGRLKKKPGQGSAQAFEKARFGQENQRESKGFFVADHVPAAPKSAKSAPFQILRETKLEFTNCH